MSHRVSIEHARVLFEKEKRLQQMQRDGQSVPRNNRRQKKYEAMRRRQAGILWRMKERIKRTGGKMPVHLGD